MITVKTLRDEHGQIIGEELHDPDEMEQFSRALLEGPSPLGFLTYEDGLITLAGINRTLVYRVTDDQPSDRWRVVARLVSDTPVPASPLVGEVTP